MRKEFYSNFWIPVFSFFNFEFILVSTIMARAYKVVVKYIAKDRRRTLSLITCEECGHLVRGHVGLVRHYLSHHGDVLIHSCHNNMCAHRIISTTDASTQTH